MLRLLMKRFSWKYISVSSQKEIYSVFFIENNTKFLGDNLASKIGFKTGDKLFSERNRNLSNNTTVSTNGANIVRKAPNITICCHCFKKLSICGF